MCRSTAREKTGLLPDPSPSRPCLYQNSLFYEHGGGKRKKKGFWPWHLAQCAVPVRTHQMSVFEFVSTALPRFFSGPPTLRQSHPVQPPQPKDGAKRVHACMFASQVALVAVCENETSLPCQSVSRPSLLPARGRNYCSMPTCMSSFAGVSIRSHHGAPVCRAWVLARLEPKDGITRCPPLDY